MAFAQDAAGLLAERAKSLGSVFKINVFGHPTACFVGPRAFALLLDDQNVVRASANPPHVEQIFNPRAVPFLDGAAHRRRKRLLMHAFKESSLEGYLPLIEQVIERYARRWADKGAFRWVPEINSLGFTIAGALFIGADPTQDDPAIEDAFAKVATGITSLPINLPFTGFGKALKARDYLMRRIDEALAAPPGAAATHVLARLREAREGDEKLGPDELRIETFHFFGAYAAVIGGLSFLVSCLGQWPKTAEAARAEILREAPEGPLTVAALNKLEYLDRLTREVRRVMPIIPLTFFGSVKRELVFDGIRIPEGHRAVGCIGATLQDDSVYPQPTQFDPDRWLHATESQRKAWIPHGGGAHVDGHRCAGEALAHLMMKTFAVQLLRGYQWTFAPGQDFGPTRGKIFATPLGGLETKFERRKA